MTKYLVSFPWPAMDVASEEMAAVGEAARDVMREAKRSGVYVFAGGVNEDVAPRMVAADGTVTIEAYPQNKELDGGFCVLELPSREAAFGRSTTRLAANLDPRPALAKQALAGISAGLFRKADDRSA